MSSTKSSKASSDDAAVEAKVEPVEVKWYRSTDYNALVLGMCNFCAPGLWGAMNSLGAGGAQSPYLVNTANALIFCLMIVSASLSSLLINSVGIRWTLVIGTTGYAPYAAGLYTNNRFGTEWFVLFGAALCGLAAGTFWMAEGAVALSYPERGREGRFLGGWLTFRVTGQIVGGAINLGINARRDHAGSVSYTVYLIFIALQCLGPICALFLTSPHKLQRRDGVKLSKNLKSDKQWREEAKDVLALFLSPKFLLLIPLIANSVYTESVMFTYLSLWFTVRARSLGSFISGVVAAISGNLFGYLLLDNRRLRLKTKMRIAFVFTASLQGGLLAWNIANSARYRSRTPTPVYDWNSPGFGNGFAVYVLQVATFQLTYLTLFYFTSHVASTPSERVRIAGLLRATESASQAVSYGLNSIKAFATLYGAVVNLGIWTVAIVPGWWIISKIGTEEGSKRGWGGGLGGEDDVEIVEESEKAGKAEK